MIAFGSPNEVTLIRWFHGTTVENAEAILRDRFKGREFQARDFLAPLKGRAYATREFDTALTYAFGGLALWVPEAGGWNVCARREAGAVLEVEMDPASCVPDEDWFGELLMDLAKDRFEGPTPYKARKDLNLEGRYVVRMAFSLVSQRTKDGWRGIPHWRSDETAIYARTGKTAVNQLQKTRAGRAILALSLIHI